jgi:hypothetical protein
MPLKHYQQLIAWQKAIAFVTEIYAVTRSFPHDEIYGLTSQIRRALFRCQAISLKVKVGRPAANSFSSSVTPEGHYANLKRRSSLQQTCTTSHRIEARGSWSDSQS